MLIVSSRSFEAGVGVETGGEAGGVVARDNGVLLGVADRRDAGITADAILDRDEESGA